MIKSQVLVPLDKALQTELGEERANALVSKVLGDQYRKFGEKWWKSRGARDLGEKMASAFEASRRQMRSTTTCSGRTRSRSR